MPVVTGIDILGIQGYVFASNRLRDVLAASWIVDHVTSRNSLSQWGLPDGQVLLAAGGNAIVEFDAEETARTWTRSYTRWLQTEAPGLEAVVVHRAYENGALARALKALQVDLARAKLERQPGAPQLGLSVTASCAVTGLPATDFEQGEPVSPRIKRLRTRTNNAKERWHEFLPAFRYAPAWNADFTDQLDLLGRSHGQTSLLGVVHVDGNGVGQAIDAWLNRCIDDDLADQALREQYRAWSGAIEELGKAVLTALVGRTADRVFENTENGAGYAYLGGTPDELGFRLCPEQSGKTAFLPLQPILLGGDDLTFVCDGRIALDLAATALRAFGKHPIPHLAGDETELMTLTACAGVALVKAHAPFHRSYELAEGLCRSAKQRRRKASENSNEPETGCWLDWHVGSTRPGDTVEDIRDRQYTRGGNALTMRPYPLVACADQAQCWDWLDRELLGPGTAANMSLRGFHQSHDAQGNEINEPNLWAGSRSRIKRLGALTPTGEVQHQVSAWRAIESGVALPAGLPQHGFIGNRTPLLDAIELMDIHLRLQPGQRKQYDDG